jgi:membrane fusion protein (multidrug efflux system)
MICSTFTQRVQLGLASIFSTLLLTACQEKPAIPPASPPEVSVITVQPTTLTFTSELPGRLEANYSAEVQARVPGIILKRNFVEGSYVKAGALLYQIDPGPYAAAVAAAKAALERNQAYAATIKQKLARYQTLLASQAISAQEYDDAVAADKQAKADVAAAEAALTKAELDLGYTKVTAPVSGNIGRAFVTEGALVGQNGPTPLALIQATDPMYVRFQQSAQEAIWMREATEQGWLTPINKETAVTLLLENDEAYSAAGKLLFTEVTVDPGTGMLTLRAQFPNPKQRLLPGTFVRVRLAQGQKQNALLVPQQAVSRNAQGTSVLTVDNKNQVVPRPIKVGKAHGNHWVVEAGLQAGEKVIVEGLQKSVPGKPVKPVPYKDGSHAQLMQKCSSPACRRSEYRSSVRQGEITQLGQVLRKSYQGT